MKKFTISLLGLLMLVGCSQLSTNNRKIASASNYPSYCDRAVYDDSPACIFSKPSYCSNAVYRNSNACIGSMPSYCSRSVYSDAKACAGYKPSYCKNAVYDEELACMDLNVALHFMDLKED